MSFLKKIVVFILILESKIIVKKYKPFIIAVTGSVGKTSTKDAIYEVAKLHFHFVRKSEKSLNSEIGLPLTIIGVSNAWYNPIAWLKNIMRGLRIIILGGEYPDCLVLEVGADHKGDIESISKWLKTDISVITYIGKEPVHVEFFKNAEELKKEKLYLVKALKDTGTLILFGDDEILNDVTVSNAQKIVRYGKNDENQICGKNVGILYDDVLNDKLPVGIKFDIEYDSKIHNISIKGVLGEHQIYSILAAISLGTVLGISIERSIETLKNIEMPRGRMRIIDGINNSLIIDDTYNSSPIALKEALKTLNNIQTNGKKVAILGDMMELGKISAEEHRKAGEMVSNIANLIVTIGPRARGIAEETLKRGKLPESVLSFDNSNEAIDSIVGRIGSGDIVLIKGSQSIRMERITKALMANPKDAESLLVRQEEEWLRKG